MADLIETATQSDSFKTLLTVAEAAGLIDTLKAEGPMTLLAPTDDAFAKVPSETLAQLMEDKLKLQKVLTYHVLPGDVRSEDLAQTDEAPTLEGSVVAVDHENGLKVNEAQVTQSDILADNGVIHVIDTVLMPAIVAGHT
jgi:uncharacterized surface protein with fasciclin (FAS1) repeats